MPPRVAALAQSESKAKFFSRLGLDPTNPTHKRAYTLMKMEAANGRRRLLERQRGDTAQIHEAAWAREVMHIYETARGETKAIYQFGLDTSDPNQPDNWIIRWLLWHVFRYRDYRNKARQPNGPNVDSPSSSDEDETPTSQPPTASGSTAARTMIAQPHGGSVRPTQSLRAQAPTYYWDPVRERWRQND